MPLITGYFDNQSIKLLKDPVLSEDMKNDYNQILNKLVAASIFNITRISIIICVSVYICTFIWIILVFLLENYEERTDYSSAVNFFNFNITHLSILNHTVDGRPF